MQQEPKIEVVISGGGQVRGVFLDGRDMSSFLTDVRLDCRAGGPKRLCLEFMRFDLHVRAISGEQRCSAVLREIQEGGQGMRCEVDITGKHSYGLPHEPPAST